MKMKYNLKFVNKSFKIRIGPGSGSPTSYPDILSGSPTSYPDILSGSPTSYPDILSGSPTSYPDIGIEKRP